MSDFAEYVEKQQVRRSQHADSGSTAPSDSGYASQNVYTEDHAELDILDSLNISETSAHVPLEDLLLGTSSEGSDETLEQLSNILRCRILEGHGETLFDLGQQDNGESMVFTREQWNVGLNRLREAAALLKADCQVLLTRNVGGAEEVGPLNEKEKGATGRIMIRQTPETVEDVIETRIAVVGNGMATLVIHQHQKLMKVTS